MKRVIWIAVLAVFVYVAVAPLAYMILASFSAGTALRIDLAQPTLDAYGAVLTDPRVTSSIATTALISLASAVLTVVLATPAAYSFARTSRPLHSLMSNSLLLAWLLPQVFIALAFFSFAADIGLYGNPWLMIFFGMLLSVPLSVWVLRSFVESIPREIDEAAALDGASLFTYLTRVLLPVAAPSMAAVAGYSFLITWQMYLYPLVYLAGSKDQMVSVGVANFVGEWSTNYPQMMAYATLITLPLIAVFLLVQRYIVSGLSSGSVNT